MYAHTLVLNWRHFLLAGIVANCGVLGGMNARAAELRIAQDQATVSIFDGDRPVLRYRFTNVPLKPYADELFSPAGVQVLRDSPHDHQHHHGLMYALTVDGVDFWGEVGEGFGKEKHKSRTDFKSLVRNGIGRAGFVHELNWVGPASDKPLLIERRTIAVLKDDDLGATLVEWRMSLQTPPGKDAISLTGHHYFGLGMRFVESMDSGGRFFNADDKPGDVVRGDERLTASKWCAYSAKANGKPVTVAIFDHPDNLRYPARMFTMAKPFAYLSATLNEWKEPVVVKAGEPLNLRYGVALWDGEADKAKVEKLYQRWLKQSGIE